MGAPGSGLVPAEQPSVDGLLDAFKTVDASDKQKHETVLGYWLSIRGNRELPPLRDLDPLEISDAASCSVLLELIGGGEDADIRHLGEQLKSDRDVEKISAAPRQSLLSSIARKLSLVAISRNFLAFEDDFQLDGAAMRCWVTLVPLSSAGAWVDYVYAFVTFGPADAAQTVQPAQDDVATEELVLEPEAALAEPEDVLELDSPVEQSPEPVASAEEAEPAPSPEPAKKPAGFSFGSSASTGFYATSAVKVKPTLPEVPAAKAKTPEPAPEPKQTEAEVSAAEDVLPPAQEESEALPEVAVEPVEDAVAEPEPESEPELEPQDELAPAVEEAVAEAEPPEEFAPVAEDRPLTPVSAMEGSLHSKLTDVRAKADEARQAKLRANAALYEGLGAAYDFALDAEEAPEEYLKLVEAKGLKIQLRAPMRPVVKLAFEGMCDDSTIKQLEAVLAWAIDQELPRGSLAQRIEEEGGIGPILSGEAQAA